MPASFVIAGIVMAITIGACLLQGFAASMSDSGYAARDATSGIVTTFVVGTIIAGLIAASHWFHLSW